MKQFLFYYVPGARGDFLALVLQNSFESRHSRHYKTSMPLEGSAKMHGLSQVYISDVDLPEKFDSYEQMFDYCREKNIITIRITMDNHGIFDTRALLDISYFSCKKNKILQNIIIHNSPDLVEPKLEEILETMFYFRSIEIADINYRPCYNYVVTFNDLFDIEKINQLYRSIHGVDIDANTKNYIIQNIELQDRLSNNIKW
jgi:hypothetical protein